VDEEMTAAAVEIPIPCMKCGAVGRVEPLIQAAARNKKVKCVACGARVDGWGNLWRSIDGDGFGLTAFAVAGATVTLVRVPIEAGKVVHLEAADVSGFTAESEVLSIHITPQGDAVFPGFLGVQRLPWTRVGLPLHMYGIPFDGAEASELAMLIQHTAASSLDPEMQQLLRACSAFMDAIAHWSPSFESVVLPCNIVLELLRRNGAWRKPCVVRFACTCKPVLHSRAIHNL
jgi:hypothetical protein